MVSVSSCFFSFCDMFFSVMGFLFGVFYFYGTFLFGLPRLFAFLGFGGLWSSLYVSCMFQNKYNFEIKIVFWCSF